MERAARQGVIERFMIAGVRLGREGPLINVAFNRAR